MCDSDNSTILEPTIDGVPNDFTCPERIWLIRGELNVHLEVKNNLRKSEAHMHTANDIPVDKRWKEFIYR